MHACVCACAHAYTWPRGRRASMSARTHDSGTAMPTGASRDRRTIGSFLFYPSPQGNSNMSALERYMDVVWVPKQNIVRVYRILRVRDTRYSFTELGTRGAKLTTRNITFASAWWTPLNLKKFRTTF